MKSGIFCAAAIMAAPLLSVSALAADPKTDSTNPSETKQVASEGEKRTDDQPANPAASQKTTEEKRTCRRVRLETGSRLATRLCKTKKEWREFNERR